MRGREEVSERCEVDIRRENLRLTHSTRDLKVLPRLVDHAVQPLLVDEILTEHAEDRPSLCIDGWRRVRSKEGR